MRNKMMMMAAKKGAAPAKKAPMGREAMFAPKGAGPAAPAPGRKTVMPVRGGKKAY